MTDKSQALPSEDAAKTALQEGEAAAKAANEQSISVQAAPPSSKTIHRFGKGLKHFPAAKWDSPDVVDVSGTDHFDQTAMHNVFSSMNADVNLYIAPPADSKPATLMAWDLGFFKPHTFTYAPIIKRMYRVYYNLYLLTLKSMHMKLEGGKAKYDADITEPAVQLAAAQLEIQKLKYQSGNDLHQLATNMAYNMEDAESNMKAIKELQSFDPAFAKNGIFIAP